MKKFTYLTLLILFTIACNRKTTTIVSPPTVDVSTPKTEIESPMQIEVEPLDVLPHAILSVKKTPCYGKCPVFEARFMSDGRVTWYGKKHTDRIGHYEAFVNPEMLLRLKQHIQKSQYFNLQPTYPTDTNKIIMDIPQTITKVQVNGQIWQVTNNYDAPKNLNELENFIEQELTRLVWRKIE